MPEENMLAKKEPQKTAAELSLVAGYGTVGGFELMQRQAKALSASQLIPKAFQGKTPDCIIALEMAARIGASPFAVLQNLYIVHGKPSWSAQFLISCVNACGRFSPLRYKEVGKKGTDSWGVIAWAKDLSDGEVLESPVVTIAIAKAEGWESKSGSKWKTMPELMLRYRAATFFARTYAPDVTMGMVTNEEAHEIKAQEVDVTESPINTHAADIELEEAEVPEAAAEVVAEEAEQEAKPATKAQPADTKELKPVADLNKTECIFEIKQHEGTAYHAGIIDENISAGLDMKDCPASMLRGIVTEIREAASK